MSNNPPEPAQPPTRADRENAQRERMQTRFAGRPNTLTTADFDLPAPNDAVRPAQSGSAPTHEQLVDAARRGIEKWGRAVSDSEETFIADEIVKLFGAAPLPAVPQPASTNESTELLQQLSEQMSAQAAEFAELQAENAKLRAATPQPNVSAGAQADRKLLEALSQYISAVLSELQFERGTGSLAAHNLRLCLIEVMKALNGTRDSAMAVGVGFPLSGINSPTL